MRLTPKTREQIEAENMLPEGNYEATVESAEDKTSKSGNEMIALKLRCYLPDGSERVISDWILEAFAAKLLDFVEAAGLEAQYKLGKLEARDCEGANVMLTIAHKKQTKGEYAGQVQASVTGYSKVQRGTPRPVVKPKAPIPAGGVEINEDDIPF